MCTGAPGFGIDGPRFALGKKLVHRHELLEQFLRIIGVEEKNIYGDVEGIEHHLSWNAMDRITDLVETLESDPEFIKKLKSKAL